MTRQETQLDRIERQLAEINRKLDQAAMVGLIDLKLETMILNNLEELTATAEATQGTINSAIVVINGIAARLVAASQGFTAADKAKIVEIVAGLKGRAAALAFAIDADAAGTAPVVPSGTPA